MTPAVRLIDGVEEPRQHGKTAHAVDEGVVDLHDEDRSVGIRFLDQDRFPERQRSVETARGHGLGHVENVSESPVFGQPNVAQVHVQGEVLVHHELRSPSSRWSAHSK